MISKDVKDRQIKQLSYSLTYTLKYLSAVGQRSATNIVVTFQHGREIVLNIDKITTDPTSVCTIYNKKTNTADRPNENAKWIDGCDNGSIK